MASKGVQGLVYVSLGIGVVGVLGANIATRVIQRKHKKQEYCTVPLKLAKQNTKCVQLLGGGEMKIKNLNLRRLIATDTEFKSAVPVWGNTRGADIYTKSSRNSVEESWQLHYAVFVVKSKQNSWRIWLHPADGAYADDDLPPEVTVFDQATE